MGSPSAEDQRTPLTIHRRLRSIIASPGWRLAALISAMLFVGSLATDVVLVENAGLKEANGLYVKDGEFNEKSMYVNVGSEWFGSRFFLFNPSSTWILSASEISPDDGSTLYRNSTQGPVPPAKGWEMSQLGVPLKLGPVPTF